MKEFQDSNPQKNHSYGQKSITDKEQENFNEQLLKKDLLGSEQSQPDSYQSEQEEESLKQKAVFQIDIKNDQISEEQQGAIRYIMEVRNQKLALSKKIKKPQLERPLHNTKPESPTQSRLALNSQTHSVGPTPSSSLPLWFGAYQNQTVLHWQCVIQNVKYLIRKQPRFSDNHRRKNKALFNSIKLQKDPQIFELMSLTLGEIQELIGRLSNDFIDFFHQHWAPNQSDDSNNIQNICDFSNKYCAWIYSLTALHQGWASYTNFENLSSINMVIHEVFRSQFAQQDSKKIKYQFVIVLSIMIQKFGQKNMTSMFSLIF